jgi:hypothetical protein
MMGQHHFVFSSSKSAARQKYANKFSVLVHEVDSLRQEWILSGHDNPTFSNYGIHLCVIVNYYVDSYGQS